MTSHVGCLFEPAVSHGAPWDQSPARSGRWSHKAARSMAVGRFAPRPRVWQRRSARQRPTANGALYLD